MLDFKCRLRAAVRLISMLTALAVICPQQWAEAAKNVIIMISDGGGHNHWTAAGMYQGKFGKQVYDQPGWLRYSATTYPLNRSHTPTGSTQQDSTIGYDPKKAWEETDQGDAPGDFAGYVYLTSNYTDSAAAATAMATGQKTYDTGINWSNDDRSMAGQTIAEIAKQAGKSAGVVTTVPWSHATPAAFGGAHNVFRNNYAAIANEMLDSSWLSVIMGAGSPDFDNSAKPLRKGKKRNYRYVGGEKTWEALKQNKRDWKLVETKEDFESLTSGATPAKVVGTAQAAMTLQENRGRIALSGAKNQAIGATVPEINQSQPSAPFAVAFNKNVPSLATMARAAINCLDDNPQGFYLMIEGGAVDWASHANLSERVIEEQIDFVKAVEAVVGWIESHGGWDETLLILTADHETGLLWGPGCRETPFQPLDDRGEGRTPGMAFNGRRHTNSLVPIYARGPGSDRFAKHLVGVDKTAGEKWRFSGEYVDNTAVFNVMHEAVLDAGKEAGRGK